MKAEQAFGNGRHTPIMSGLLVDEYSIPTTHYTLGEPLQLDVVLWPGGEAACSLEIVLAGEARKRLPFGSLQAFHGVTLPRESRAYTTRLEIESLWARLGRLLSGHRYRESGFRALCEVDCFPSGLEQQSR
jgi:hypothetical protein